jgi:hypothetical protein
MTAKQKAARERFKKVVAEAGKLRKKNPKLTQAQAVKQAFAMQKKVGAIKIIEKGESKSSKAKAVYQQVRTKKGTFKGLKKVGAVAKKSAPKKVASKRITDIHKDSKSHNVNIRVVSGTKKTNDMKDTYTDYLIVKEKIQSSGPIVFGKSMVIIYSKLLNKSTQSLYIRKSPQGSLYISQKGQGGTASGDIAKVFSTKQIEVNSNLYKRLEILAKKADAFI